MDKQKAIEEAARECLKRPAFELRNDAHIACDALDLGATHSDIEDEMKRQRGAS